MQLPQHTIAQSTYTDLNRLNKLKVGEDRDSEANLRQVAREFESLFISEMMKAMRSANDVLADDLFNSNESKTYRDMYDQQMAVTLSQGKGMGMADVLVRQMEGLQQGRARPNPFAEAKTVLENTTEVVREPARAADSRQATTEREGNRAAPGIAVDKPKYVHVADTTDIRFRRFTGIVARPAVQHLRLDSAPDKQAGAAAGSQALRSYAQIKHSLPVAPGQLTQKTRFDSPEEFVAAMMPMAEQAAQRLGVDPKYLVAQAALKLAGANACSAALMVKAPITCLVSSRMAGKAVRPTPIPPNISTDVSLNRTIHSVNMTLLLTASMIMSTFYSRIRAMKKLCRPPEMPRTMCVNCSVPVTPPTRTMPPRSAALPARSSNNSPCSWRRAPALPNVPEVNHG